MPSLPPIIERELRRMSNQPKTYVARSIFAAAPFFFILGAIAASNGREALKIVAMIAGCLAHFAGGLSVARAIIEERRQGTLPILYLTPLTPVEMIGGMLSTHLAVAFSHLMSVVPAMAVSIAVGGVSAWEVAIIALTLVNAVFCSTALGMLIGSFAREQGQPVFTAIMAMVILGLLTIPTAAYLVHAGPASPAMLFAGLLGSMPLLLAFDAGGTQSPALFPTALVLSHGCAWLMVLAAGHRCLLIARSAGDKPVSSGLLGFGRQNQNGRTRSPMDKNPVEWLLARNPSVSRIAWGLFFCIAMATTAAFVVLPHRRFVELLPSFYLVGYAFKLLAFSAGCDFFLREKKTGGMELMLTSMLTAGEIRTGAVFGFVKPMLAAYACSAGVALCFGAVATTVSDADVDSLLILSGIVAVVALDLLSALTTALLSGAEFPTYRKSAFMAWVRGFVAPSVMVVAIHAEAGFVGAFGGALIGSAIASWWAWQAISQRLDGLRKESLDASFSPAFLSHFTHPTLPANETPR